MYRFVRNSELRLLWGIAPLPELKTVTYQDAIDAHKSVVCVSGPMHLETRRRTDPFSRIDKPDEKPEPLILGP